MIEKNLFYNNFKLYVPKKYYDANKLKKCKTVAKIEPNKKISQEMEF